MSVRRSLWVWLLVAVAGCGGSAETAVEHGHAARFTGAVTSDRRLTLATDGSRITLSPPKPGESLPLSWRDALRLCFDGPIGCVTSGSAVVFVARVSGPNDYPTADGNAFPDDLAYIIVWEPGACSPAVAPGLSGCRVVNIVPGRLPIPAFAFEIDARTPLPR